MSNTADPELRSVLTNACKPSKILTSQELCSPLGLFGLKSVHAFFILVGRITPVACLVFYLVIKVWESLYNKTYQTWKTEIKKFKIHQKFQTGTQKTRPISQVFR